ncbi:Glycosyltransferase involved in cell wall bisynthesis [Candidatus Methylobacter favarea]|uniref:Glycosyltransferase involved in cell wall bisynthesis n=1 Tax=Candidatus Methylobacter favarea TaxID=2707345 RepID=A0A8S0WYA8_9GAMM|nr:glycosyltransferase [Candidatus Methylobacter favarea]CAA9889493.1 Glycosyltransferase involved in cell wall bisynthesis [Candidatus Methylobacter favarea]
MLVSIYLPTKNRLESMKAAVDSVLRQTYTNLELIIVDDGSTDGTADYLNELVRIDARVKFLRNEISRGACYARNRAIKASTGEFITGLDDDDEFISSHIGALVDYWSLLTTHSSTFPSCIYTQNIYKNNEVLSESKKMSRVEYTDLFEGNHIGNQIFAPRSHFIETGLFDENMPAWQDLEFFFRILKKFGAARLLDLNSYIFDISLRPDRISSAQKARILEASDRMITLHADNRDRGAQRFLLQAYGDYYNFPLTFKDLCIFLRHGFWWQGLKVMILNFLKRDFQNLKRKLILN